MKLGPMLDDILRGFFHRPVTQTYPAQREPVPTQLRGNLHYNPEKCTGCALCIKDCPADAIELITIDKVAKKFVLRYHVDRCTFCAQCVQNCRFKCISMSADQWELASLGKEAFTVYYGDEKDVANLLGQHLHPSPSTP